MSEGGASIPVRIIGRHERREASITARLVSLHTPLRTAGLSYRVMNAQAAIRGCTDHKAAASAVMDVAERSAAVCAGAAS